VLHRAYLPDQPAVLLALRVADAVAKLALGLLAAQGGHHLVAAHADVAVDAPDRQDDVVGDERAKPGDRVLIIGIHQRAVDVENGGAHARPNTPSSRSHTETGVPYL
jgi:hypothetical protein